MFLDHHNRILFVQSLYIISSKQSTEQTKRLLKTKNGKQSIIQTANHNV